LDPDEEKKVIGKLKHCTLPLFVILVSACATRRSNDSAVRENKDEFTEIAINREQRNDVLGRIQKRIAEETEPSGKGVLKWGKGAPECQSNEFAFGVSKAGYELDAFELRAKFLNPALTKTLKLKTPVDKSELSICTDTRQSRPMIVLSSGIEAARKDSLELNTDDLKALGVSDGTAKTGEVIIANFFHLKRFWIARIPLSGIEKTYFQLEHFPVLPAAAGESENQGVIRNLRDKAITFANKNIAGHTQIRAKFKSETPVTLYEQVTRSDAQVVRQINLFDIVLSSEAQGTLAQVGPNGYDPVKAKNPLFFSVNKIVSVHEKYSDMVVRQRHWVEQFHLHIDGSKKQEAGDSKTKSTENPSFGQVFTRYIEMSRMNWQAMTQADPSAQEPAVYRTLDATVPTRFTKNKTRNCTTELINVLEVDGRGSRFQNIKAWGQDITLKRAYPMFLGFALNELGLITLDKPEPGMDGDGNLPTEEKLKATDDSLRDVREHFADLETCRIYFGNDEDRAKCLSWKKVIFPTSGPQ
jgi:hypothetical protein